MNCEHFRFLVSANVARLTEKEGGPAVRFAMELKAECADCGQPFEFRGLPIGLNITDGAYVSPDGLELRTAIFPHGQPMPYVGGPTGFEMRERDYDDETSDVGESAITEEEE